MRSKSVPKPLARWALESQLAPLRKAKGLTRPSRGWIKAIRESLGMTTAQLAKRVGVSQPRITAIEKAEANDSVTLRTLRETAEGLGCKLVYALVPDQSLEQVVNERARRIADEQLSRTHHTMKLENQAVEPRRLKRERERLVDELLRGDPRRLWDEP